MNQKNLFDVDWSQIPAPTDDGAAAHLPGLSIPPVSLMATNDTLVTLALAKGKNAADKRETEKEREWNREKSRIMKYRE